MIGLAKLAEGPGNVALAERPEPDAAPGHVVLDVAAAGICGTDIHILKGEYPVEAGLISTSRTASTRPGRR